MKKLFALLVLIGSFAPPGAPVSALPSPDPVPPTYLPQNWSKSEREWFYSVSQGSRLLQYAWFMSLEQASGETPFTKNLDRYGYLPNPKNPDNPDNPDGLPVGFAADTDVWGDKWVGLTCSACHTNQVSFHGATLQIDGAPSHANFYAFLSDLAQSITATDSNVSGKFDRFAQKVGGNKKNLKKELDRCTSYFTKFIQDSTPDTPWGPARLDAFGMIFNRVTSIDLAIPSNSQKPTAPVSYPFLWDTSWHNVVQWNGSAPNKTAFERLIRNVGEVLGVFGTLDLDPHFNLSHPYFGYASSVKMVNQYNMEDQLSRLQSPQWPEQILGAIDADKAAKGQAIYKQLCISCHTLWDRGHPKQTNVVMTDLLKIGTDPAMVENSAQRKASTGCLKDAYKYVLPFPGVGKIGPDPIPSLSLTAHAVIGAVVSPIPADWTSGNPCDEQPCGKSGLMKKMGAAPTASLNFSQNSQKIADAAIRQNRNLILAYQKDSKAEVQTIIAYKARPLDGVWATAPYLHNGSVPDLYQLLLPDSQRVKHFTVGSQEFDPVHVGFLSGSGDGSFTFDTTLKGNYNTGHTGHEYGTDLSEEDRSALIEYLKTL